MASTSGKKLQDKSSMGLTKINVRGFKCLADNTNLVIRPLTILAGANSSGKSSIMQPLLLLKQTLEATYDPGALLLRGANVRFTHADQLLTHTGPKVDNTSFSVGLELNESLHLELMFRKAPKKSLDVVEMTFSQGLTTLRISPGMSQEAILATTNEDDVLRKYLEEKEKTSIRWEVFRSACFLQFALVSSDRKKTFFRGSFKPSEPFEDFIRRVIHVPGLRGNPERTYPTTAIGNIFPGTFESYVASILNHWQENKDPRLGELGKALECLGLTWKVETKPIDDTQVELRVGRLPHATRGGARDLVSIADVGFGVSQTLPVIVALLAAEPGQLVYLEQPEIHLHPFAQNALANLMADAAKRGVRLVAETHSATLLLALQALVAEGQLDSNLVKLHWFTRREDGVTQLSSADLDESGAFGDWPEDFGTVALQAEDRYLTAIEHRRATV